MRIGIIGTGNIGGNLGRGWSKREHEITFGVRDTGKISDLLADCGGRARATDPAAAAAFGDAVVLALPWKAVPEILPTLGDLSGKIVIDCTNPLTWDDGPVHAAETSAAEIIASRLPGASVVKAFNSVGAEHLLDPAYGDRRASMLVAGDDPQARRAVAALAEDLGFQADEAGPLRNARGLEQLAVLWIHLAMVEGKGRNIAFALLEK